MNKKPISLLAGAAAGTLSFGIACAAWALNGTDDGDKAKDPGVRGGAPGAGTPIKNLSTLEGEILQRRASELRKDRRDA